MSAEWEEVCSDGNQRTERLKVQSGYIYRSVIWDTDYDENAISGSTSQSMTFAPSYPIKVKTG